MSGKDMKRVHDFSVENAIGETVDLSQYKGKVLLIVNTASQCGFTPQYDGLQKLQETYGPQGFEVLAFPCNQFGKQEPGSNEEIQEFCEMRFNTTFPVFAKIDVNGAGAHPLYQHLKKSAPGIMGTKAIKWNFTKFLINQDGRVVKRYGSNEKPEGIENEIKKLLNIRD